MPELCGFESRRTRSVAVTESEGYDVVRRIEAFEIALRQQRSVAGKEEHAVELPPQVQSLVDAISSLPGVAGCFCSPKPLADTEVGDLTLPGEFGDLPQAIIMRTNGGRENEVMIQTEVIFDRSSGAWLSLEFLAWWVRDWGRSGREIQMRPMALPPKAYEIQLGRTLKFFIEYFVIEDGDSYEKTLAVAGEMGESISSCFELYRECFANPAEFTGDVESI